MRGKRIYCNLAIDGINSVHSGLHLAILAFYKHPIDGHRVYSILPCQIFANSKRSLSMFIQVFKKHSDWKPVHHRISNNGNCYAHRVINKSRPYNKAELKKTPSLTYDCLRMLCLILSLCCPPQALSSPNTFFKVRLYAVAS